MAVHTQKQKVGWKTTLAYGSGDIFGGGSIAIIGLWLMFFYTKFGGLTATQAGSILAISRFIDAFFDPLMGYVTDNFHRSKFGKRFGRRGFFFLLGIPFSLTYSLLWISDLGYWYYLLTYILFGLVFSLITVPYETLSAEMTRDFNVRSRLTTVRLIFSQGSTFVAAWLPGVLIGIYGEKSPFSFFLMGAVFSIIFAIIMVGLYRFTFEEPVEEKVKAPLHFKEDMKKLFKGLLSTFKIRTFRLHTLMYAGAYAAQDIFGATFAYYVAFALGENTVLASKLLSTMGIIQMIFIPIFAWACVKLGNGSAYQIALGTVFVSILAYISVYYFASAHVVAMLYVIAIFMGIGRSGTYFVPWNIYSFIPDVDQMLTRERREGIFAGTMTFIRKLVQSIALFLVGIVLDGFGFASGNEAQPAQAITGIMVVFGIGTLLFVVFGFIVSLRFKLNKHRHEVLITEIQRLESGGSMQDVDDQTRKVVEELTGWEYERTWGNNNIGDTPPPKQPKTTFVNI
ncbi:MFS transporter [Priestia koreensis]|uniref:MFS transporter n=1 Tax=Priestia koreensis TaxID=284581 RepID=A0A0M0L7T3_9BACI|nr:MFS transporter [Priestia koreensis]KOO46912.1 MFS transporter [Priestia koreensis]